jgi:hypothetical protein
MCNLCATRATALGEVLPGWTLYRANADGEGWKAGEWGLSGFGQPDLAWSVDPIPDPCVGMTDAEVNAISPDVEAALLRHLTALNAFIKQFRMCNGLAPIAELVRSAVACGWSRERDGYLEAWLFARMGAHLVKRGC